MTVKGDEMDDCKECKYKSLCKVLIDMDVIDLTCTEVEYLAKQAARSRQQSADFASTEQGQ